MRALEGGRVAIAAQALGVGQAALDEALAYARTRQAFGQPIGNFQAIQFQLADLATDLEAARHADVARGRHARPRAAAPRSKPRWPSSRRPRPRTAPPIARCRSSRPKAIAAGRRIERLFRDVRAAEIYQGTSEVQRMIIAEHVTDYR